MRFVKKASPFSRIKNLRTRWLTSINYMLVKNLQKTDGQKLLCKFDQYIEGGPGGYPRKFFNSLTPLFFGDFPKLNDARMHDIAGV